MISQEQVYNFIVAMDEGNKMYSNPTGFCFFLRLNDKTLNEIKSNFALLTNLELIKNLLTQTGKNIHFIGAYGRGFKVIRQAIKNIINKERPNSISWFNKDMNHFIYRRITCQLQ